MSFEHKTVLLHESIDGLNIRPGRVYVDGTMGGAGHSYEICKRLNESGCFIGIDQDGEAIAAGKKKLESFGDMVHIYRQNYEALPDVLAELQLTGVDGILLDLGVSSHQLDTEDRGFSYNVNVSLDMRMDQRQEKTARDIINDYDVDKLYRVIRDYGEEKFARNIARNILRERQNKVIETTDELVEIIKMSIPKKFRITGGHPAKRTFQAIRIELNRELEVLNNSLNQMIALLNDEGRICIISFHSLEDRIVKTIFKENENPCTCPPNFPICVCGKKPTGKIITRKPIYPSDEEIQENKRSKSAKLRIFERIK